MFDYAAAYGEKPDRTWRNSDDGEVFYGFDSDDGKQTGMINMKQAIAAFFIRLLHSVQSKCAMMKII